MESRELEERARRRVGSMVRRKYRLDRLLGVGGTAAVFSATHRNGSAVALKVLHPELAKMTQVRDRFLREGYVANKIGHTGVVRVIDDDDDDEQGTVFLVMELLDGETLEAIWERNLRRVPVGAVVAWSRAVLDVLASAHASGVVHRDVKPQNLFVTRSGELRVLDFGIARLLDGTGATQTGQVMGTPAFMSPEQANGQVRDVGPASDLWSLGATMFTLLSGRDVHQARGSTEQMIYAATQHAPGVGSVAPDVPASIAAVVDKALSFERGNRWPSASAMKASLEAAIGVGSAAADDAAATRRRMTQTLLDADREGR